MEDLSGKRLGDFHLQRKLGQGGMATVYLAEDEKLKRQVAFKVLKPSLARKPEQVKRFLDEARAAALVVHPNIVQIFDMGAINDVHFIAQEFVEGRNLKQHLNQSGPLSLPQAVSVMRQIALALHKAAEKSVIHRDIKPENVLLTESGEAKVTDFGLARVAWDPEAVRTTQPGMVMGTPLYMSPEQIEDREVDHRSDLYSLGVTCYHLLLGKPPFQGETPLSVAMQHVNAKPMPLPQLRADVPESLWQIIARLLEKDPDDRFASAAELLQHLRILLETEGAEWDLAADFAVEEMVSLSEHRTHASTQLQVAMNREQQRRQQGMRSGLALIAGLVVAIPLGIAIAYMTKPETLLSRPAAPAADEPLDNINEQYTHALIAGTEEAIRAVWTHHSPNDSREEHLVWMAKRRMAQLLVSEARYNEAELIFEELAALPETELSFRVFGQLGRGLLEWTAGDKVAAADLIAPAIEGLADLSPADREPIFAMLPAGLKDRVRQRLNEHLRQRRTQK